MVDGAQSRVESIETLLADVTSLDQDRILRSLLGLVNATLRTNAYRTDETDSDAGGWTVSPPAMLSVRSSSPDTKAR